MPKKFTKIILSKDGEFIVRDDKILIYIICFLFFAVFMYGIIEAIVHHFQNSNWFAIIFIAPAILLYSKARKDKIYLRVNKKGIYEDRELVTTWAYLIKASISQKKRLGSFQDNFILVIEYRREEDIYKGFRKVIPLTNTQNKSEEEVMSAIRYFLKQYRLANGLE